MVEQQTELFELLEAPVVSKEHLLALAERALPKFLRPEQAPHLMGIDLLEDDKFLSLIPNLCTNGIPPVGAVNLTRLFILTGKEPTNPNGWVLFFRSGLPGFLVVGLLALEAYKLRFALPTEEKLTLTDEEHTDSVARAVSAITGYLPLYSIRILKSLWASGVKNE